MENLNKFLLSFKQKKALFLFPHPDDHAYVAGGVLQVCQNLSIKTKIICVTKGGRIKLPDDKKKINTLKNIRIREFKKSSVLLAVDDFVIWDYPDGLLLKYKKGWNSILKNEVERYSPDIMFTFDPSGITGHPDHLIVSHEVFQIAKNIKKKPLILLRVPDSQEISYFRKNKYLKYSLNATHELNYSFSMNLKKIKAILSHQSQIINFFFRLHIVDWFLFDHRELYHVSKANDKFPYKINIS